MRDRIVIKKYANRRLYDTSNSRYINLEDIAALVRNGKELQVVDASTGEDITRVTLTQIIVEDAKEQPSGLPLELLRQLIVASDRVGQEFIMWYLKSAFDAYQNVQSSLQTRLSEMQSAALSPLQMVKSFHADVRRRRRASDNARSCWSCAGAWRSWKRQQKPKGRKKAPPKKAQRKSAAVSECGSASTP